ncbi:MAG: hypothetical protein CMH49_08995 [Myxococcales bacterium]|nr:hypothetical protein [Myxococcales bacterium]
MLLSLSLTLLALSAVLHQQKTKALFDQFQVQINELGSLSAQKLIRFIQRSTHTDPQFTVLSMTLNISPAQALDISVLGEVQTENLKKQLSIQKHRVLYLTERDRFNDIDPLLLADPLSESFLANKSQAVVINSLPDKFFSFTSPVYELSLPLDQKSISARLSSHLVLNSAQQRPRWILRFSKSTVLDTLTILSSEQSHILVIEALILVLFSFYLIHQTLILPILKLSEFAQGLKYDEHSLAPLHSASTELLLLQESLVDFHQALREEQRTLAVLYQKLAEHERTVTSKGLSARVMHEIGNPLASVMGLVDYLRTEISTNSQLELLDLAYTELNRIKQLSKQVLNSAKPSHASSEFSILCEWAQMMLKYHNEYSMIRLILTGVKNARLRIPLEITQIALMNLLMNAARAQSGQGIIRIHCVHMCSDSISAGPLDKILKVYVLDQGTDVLETIRPVLFEPWQSSDQEGHGLGLMIARSSLEQYGATLEYLPKLDRQIDLDHEILRDFDGACFCLSMPLFGDESEEG